MGVYRLVGCFPLCGRGEIVGGLLTASGFTAFALSGFGVVGGRFLTASGPSKTTLT